MNAIKVRKCALPIILKHQTKSEKAVLGIHGYAGYPGELALPAKKLYEAGYDVFVIRLPGHGTSGFDFMQTDKEMWLKAAKEAYEDLAKEYEQVDVMGHSMGGAIAIILASLYPIKALVLYAPALIIPKLNHTLISIARFFIKKKKIGWQADKRYKFFDERDEDDDQYLGSEYWSILHTKQLYNLSLLTKEAQSALSKVTAAILVFTGQLDVTVDPKVGSSIKEHNQKQNEAVHYEKGTHLIPYDIDENVRVDAMEKTVAWIKQH
jgi:carboxylesterase